MTFINYIFSTCQALAQTSTPISPYRHYIPPSPNNQDIEFSYSPLRNNSQELVQNSISPNSHYFPPSTNNQDTEFPHFYLPTNNPQELGL